MLQVGNADGDSPFHLAVKNNSIRIFDMLMETLDGESEDQRRQILNLQNKDGDTILHIAY